MSRISATFEVVGKKRGQTFTFRSYNFVNGRVTIEGDPYALKHATSYLASTQQAYPVGSPELKAALELHHGDVQVHPDRRGGKPVEVPRGGAAVPQPHPAPEAALVGRPEAAPPGGAAGLPEGDGPGRAPAPEVKPDPAAKPTAAVKKPSKF